jgi:peptidoglycan/xylan/chitin deacetylase (PgdA/CDA1 family)
MLKRLSDGVSRRVVNAWPVKPVRSQLDEPMVSITFDDFPRSAWTEGGPALARFGFRATYFVSGAFCGEGQSGGIPAGRIEGVDYCRREDIVAADAAGHEIGCHTFGHVRVPLMTNLELERSLSRNEEFLRNLIPGKLVTTFAYPQGAVDLRTKRFVGRRFTACRGTTVGLNAGWIDFALLLAIPLDAAFAETVDVDALVARIKQKRGWLIFYGHDIGPRPSRWGCSLAALQELLMALSRARLAVMPLGEAAARVRGL